jgi:hypothetical protein
MATKSFPIDYYRTSMGYKRTITVSGVKAQLQGHIACFGEQFHRLMIYFLHPDSPVPLAYFNPGRRQGAIFLPFSEMSTYLDMVRNEKPIYVYLDSENPEWNSIRTGSEPVGEEES